MSEQEQDVSEDTVRAQRHDQARRKLLAVATELFSQNGYHRTQVMDIVSRAHVSAATFYRYFEDKQSLFLAIVAELAAHELEEARKARAMIMGAPDFEAAVHGMVQFLERHFERVMERAALYRALHNSGVVDGARDHAWAMHELMVKALAEQLALSSPKDTEDLESLARMIMGVSSELRYAMLHTGQPTPARAARLAARFLQGALAAFSIRKPHHGGSFSKEWKEILDRVTRD